MSSELRSNYTFVRKDECFDAVTKPIHYYINDTTQVMDVIEWVIEDQKGIQAGHYYNAIKYLLRSPRKNGLEDLEKAHMALGLLIESVKKENK